MLIPAVQVGKCPRHEGEAPCVFNQWICGRRTGLMALIRIPHSSFTRPESSVTGPVFSPRSIRRLLQHPALPRHFELCHFQLPSSKIYHLQSVKKSILLVMCVGAGRYGLLAAGESRLADHICRLNAMEFNPNVVHVGQGLIAPPNVLGLPRQTVTKQHLKIKS